MSAQLLNLQEQYNALKDQHNELRHEMMAQARINQQSISQALKYKRALGNVRLIITNTRFKCKHEIEKVLAETLDQ